LLYVRGVDHAQLCVAVAADAEQKERTEGVLEAVHAALTALNSGPRSYQLRARASRTHIAATHERGAADWAERVAAICSGIAAGRLEKVVLARRVLLTLEPTPDPFEVL
jgi:isochorismate synthase EntC